MKKTLFLAGLGGLALSALTGCSEDLSYEKLSANEQIQYVLESFDYSTWGDYTLNINLGHPGLVYLYDQDPTTTNAQAIDGAFVDASGRYSAPITLSAGLQGKEMWAKSCSGVTKCVLTPKGMYFDFTNASRGVVAPDSHNADGTVIFAEGNETPTYPEFVTKWWEGNDNYKAICKTLETTYHGVLQMGVDNTLFVETNNVGRDMEITISQSNGDKRVPVRASMIDYGDGSHNGHEGYCQMYYYYYKRNPEHPSVREAMTLQEFVQTFCTDKFLFCCNDRTDWHDCYDNDPHGGGQNYVTNTQSLGYTNPLFYYGDEYDATVPATASDYTDDYNFPKGVTIGVFMAVKTSGGSLVKLHFGNENGAYYLSGTEFANSIANDTRVWKTQYADEESLDVLYYGEGDRAAYATAFDLTASVTGDTSSKKHRLLYSFEDQTSGGDKDCDDEMFMISVLGDIDTDILTEVVPWVREGTYLFEDLYPKPGDYDMNDAAIKYKYQAIRLAGEDISSPITSFAYSFEVVHNGATYDNDFGVCYDDYGNRKIFFTGCNVGDKASGRAISVKGNLQRGSDEWASYFIGKYTSSLINKTIRHEFWTSPTTKSSIDIKGGINPFIYCNTTSHEVHMPLYYGADINDQNLGNDERLYKFMSNGHNAPFAIDVSTTSFEIVEESRDIRVAYPKFIQWVESNGTDYTNWWEKD